MANISKIKLPNSDTIYNVIDNGARAMIAALPKGMIFRGSLGAAKDNPTITELPEPDITKVGDTYKVITPGTYAGQVCKVGDMFICAEASIGNYVWVYIPSGNDGTMESISAGTGLVTDTGEAITTSGTISLSDASIASLAKADAAIPTPASPVTGQFLKKIDGGWETAVVDALPAQAGQSGKYLTTDGTAASWATLTLPEDMTGATASSAGTHGLVPAPAAGDQNKFLKGDATWGEIDLSAKADIAAPTLTTKTVEGVVSYPASATVRTTGGDIDAYDRSTKIATTEFVQAAVATEAYVVTGHTLSLAAASDVSEHVIILN